MSIDQRITRLFFSLKSETNGSTIIFEEKHGLKVLSSEMDQAESRLIR
jgi:hypothetical protein